MAQGTEVIHLAVSRAADLCRAKRD
jgi:hypothetical protein